MKYEITCSFCGHSQVYTPRKNKVPKNPHTKCKKCSKEFNFNIESSEYIPRISKISQQESIKRSDPKKTKRNLHSSTNLDVPGSDHPFIDDPDELLMSVAKRMLNMPSPDPRWATILLNCRKENLTNKNELTEQLSKANTRSLVGLLKKNSLVEQE